MKILIITDSLGLPRDFPEKLNYNETWVYLLSNHFEVHQLSFGGATIDVLFSQLGYLKLFNPDLVFIQSGIVDCTPRALSKFENKLINRFSILKWLFNKLLKKDILFKLRKYRNLKYTLPFIFSGYVNKFNAEFKNKLFWIEIIPPTDFYENKIPGIKKNVIYFNELISNVVGNNFVSTNDFSTDELMSDHIHLNTQGNFKLFERIKTIVVNHENHS
ncbi:MAG: SGNH/GDSL hydrolase family protein [Bacteroidetes bacterium]|nr:SGNH/GDSL hydrolase family protein [Bacteroidota bacterium]